MTVSVVIPTFNRCESLKNLLDSLNSQSVLDFEVIISVDGSTDGTIEYLNKNYLNYNFPIRYFAYKNGGRAKARNRGVEQSTSDLLIFYDDDCRPNVDSVKHHIDSHKKYQNAIFTGAAIYDKSASSEDYFQYRRIREHEWYIQSDHPIESKSGVAIIGANWSVKRCLFLSLGGLNELLTDSEDFEFGVRAKKNHVSIFHYYKLWVYHDDFQSLSGYVKRRKVGNKSSVRLLSLYPEIKKQYLDKKFTFHTKNPFLFLLIQLCRFDLIISAVDSNAFRKLVFSRKVRYKFYELISLAYSYPYHKFSL